jgi:hypothetical protein
MQTAERLANGWIVGHCCRRILRDALDVAIAAVER